MLGDKDSHEQKARQNKASLGRNCTTILPGNEDSECNSCAVDRNVARFACDRRPACEANDAPGWNDRVVLEHASACKIFVQVLRGMFCFRGVSWLLLCTSKEVTRSACGRAEALAVESHPLAGRERKTAGCASRTEQDHFRATLTRACGAASPASRTGDRQNFSVHQVFASALRTRSARGFRACDAAPPADRRTTIRRRDRRECRSAKRPG